MSTTNGGLLTETQLRALTTAKSLCNIRLRHMPAPQPPSDDGTEQEPPKPGYSMITSTYSAPLARHFSTVCAQQLPLEPRVRNPILFATQTRPTVTIDALRDDLKTYSTLFAWFRELALLGGEKALTGEKPKKVTVPVINKDTAVVSAGKLLLAADELGCADWVKTLIDRALDKSTPDFITLTDAVKLLCTGHLGLPSATSTKLRTLVVNSLADLTVRLEEDVNIADGPDKENITWLQDRLSQIPALNAMMTSEANRQKQAIAARIEANDKARKEGVQKRREFYREKAKRERAHKW